MSSTPHKATIPLRAVSNPADMWDALVKSGVDPDEATARVSKLHGKPPIAGATESRGAGGTWEEEPRTSILGGINNAALNTIPFADELRSAITAGLEADDPSQPNQFRDTYNREQDEFEQDTKSFARDHPVVSGATNLAVLTGIALAAAPLGFVRGAALLGGAEAAGKAEGKGRAIAALIGAGAGALIGKGGETLSKIGAKKIMTGIAALVGSKAGDTPLEHAEGAAGAAAGVNLAGRAGSAIGQRVQRSLGRDMMAILDREAVGEVAKAAERAKIKPGDVSEMAKGALPGTRLYHLGQTGGPLQSLTRAAESIPSQGAAEIRTAAQSSRLAPSAAEKSVRRALGNRFKNPSPLVKETKAAISAESKPAYDALEGETISAKKLAALAEDEPVVLEIWKAVQDLGKKRAKAGMGGSADIPDLVTVAEDGTKTYAENIPVLGLDLTKRALRHVVEKSRNGPNPLTAEDAEILGKRLSDVMDAAKNEKPAYAEALKTFGDATEKRVLGLTQRTAGDRFVLGNSITQRLKEGQEDLTQAPIRLGGLNPKKAIEDLVHSTIATRMRGFNEAKVNALAPYLTKEMTPEGAAEIDRLLLDFADRELERRLRGGAVPRALSLGAGSLVGRANDDRK